MVATTSALRHSYHSDLKPREESQAAIIPTVVPSGVVLADLKDSML